MRGSFVCQPAPKKHIHRNLFARALKDTFNKYIADLAVKHCFDSEVKSSLRTTRFGWSSTQQRIRSLRANRMIVDVIVGYPEAILPRFSTCPRSRSRPWGCSRIFLDVYYTYKYFKGYYALRGTLHPRLLRSIVSVKEQHQAVAGYAYTVPKKGPPLGGGRVCWAPIERAMLAS